MICAPSAAPSNWCRPPASRSSLPSPRPSPTHGLPCRLWRRCPSMASVAPAIVHDRVDYAGSMIDGRTVQETDPKGRSAAEMAELWDFVKAQMAKSTKARKKEGEPMSKKPAAALSANLVAVKGTAAPAPDMPGRAAPAAPTPAVVADREAVARPAPAPPCQQGRGREPAGSRSISGCPPRSGGNSRSMPPARAQAQRAAAPAASKPTAARTANSQKARKHEFWLDRLDRLAAESSPVAPVSRHAVRCREHIRIRNSSRKSSDFRA